MTASIRPAAERDLPAVMGLIRELAVYEKLEHLLRNNEDKLREHLFREGASVRAFVAELEGVLVGYAISFLTYSSFLGEQGVWLEDLYVSPIHRGTGIGKALLGAVAAQAAEVGGRMEWVVLDWNQPAIDFYERMGARRMLDWQVCRLDGDVLDRLTKGG